MEVKVPATRIGFLREKIAEMNRKAAKLGCEPITLNVGVPYIVTRKHEFTGFETKETFYPVEVSGVAPKLNGYVFVAKLEPTENGNLVKCNVGETAPAWAWSRDMDCDHCHTKRYRTETFIVRKGNEYVLLGRNCLADYLGGKSPEAIARMAEWDVSLREALDDDWYGYRGTPSSENIVSFVAMCNAVARCVGFVTRKMVDEGKASGLTTAERTWWMSLDAKEYSDFVKDHPSFNISQDDYSFAETCLAYGKNITEDNDFARNLRVACASDVVDNRSKGIVAAVIPAYLRNVARQNEVKNQPTSNHIGSVGEKVAADVKVTFVKYLHGDYGVTTMISMVDGLGNVIVWFASGEYNVEAGDFFRIRGTVKKCDEYRGVKQTILTRCKIVD